MYLPSIISCLLIYILAALSIAVPAPTEAHKRCRANVQFEGVEPSDVFFQTFYVDEGIVPFGVYLSSKTLPPRNTKHLYILFYLSFAVAPVS